MGKSLLHLVQREMAWAAHIGTYVHCRPMAPMRNAIEHALVGDTLTKCMLLLLIKLNVYAFWQQKFSSCRPSCLERAQAQEVTF